MQKHKKTLALLAMLSLIATNGLFSGLVNNAQAISLSNARDLLTNSDVSGVSTHSVTFTIKTALVASDEVTVTFPNFTTVVAANATCGGSFGAPTLPIAGTLRCAAAGAIATNTVVTMTVTGVTNPASVGSQHVLIQTNKTGGGLVIDRADVMVAIVDNVDVSVTVPSTLLFVISPVATGTVVNTGTTTAMSATTSLAFGTLEVGTSSIMAQQLTVVTNASFGYTVTVHQNQDLTSNTGATIDAFKDGTATRDVWSTPLGTLDATSTYGHMGFTSNDTTLSSAPKDFTTGQFDGFVGTTTEEVMYHTGPADGQFQSKGKATVAYRIQISALQEAGDYYNTLTYVATPTY